jgi:hypothetical protein
LNEVGLCDGPDFKGSTLITSARGKGEDAELAPSRREGVPAFLEAEFSLEVGLFNGLAFVDSAGVISVGGDDDAVLYELARGL